MKSNLKFIGIVCLLVCVIIFGALLSLDLKNMEEGKPVFFSTWGRKYSPVEEADASEIKKLINSHIVVTQEKNKKSASEKWFCANKTFLISKSDDIYTAYSWVYATSYINKYNGELLENNSLSKPYKFELKKSDDKFEVIEMITPEDGNLYEEDLKAIFPENVANYILKVEKDDTVDSLQIDIQNQIAEYHN